MIRRRRVLNRHRALLAALDAIPAMPRRRREWPENVGVARKTIHVNSHEYAAELGNTLITRGELLRGDQ